MGESTQTVALAMGDGPGLGGGWTIAKVSAEPRGHVMVEVHREDDGANVEVLITSPGASAEAFAETPFGNVAYREYSGLTEKEVAEVTRSFAEHIGSGNIPLAALFPHLAVEASETRPEGETRARLEGMMTKHQRLLPGAVSVEGSLALPVAKQSLFFDPPGIAEYMAPELVIDGAPIGEYTLTAIYLPPVARRETPDFKSYVLEFSQDGGGPATHVVVGTRGAFPQVFGFAGPLAVGVRHFGQGEQDGLGPEQAQICSWVVALLEMKQAQGFELIVPQGAQEVRALSLPAHRAQALDITVGDDSKPVMTEQKVLNLSIDADCGQQCTFCSVKSYLEPEDGGEKELERIKMQLRKAKADGIGGIRINGIDPMAFSKILETVEAIEELGFKRLSVYATGRVFADPAFRKAFLERYSSELYIVIPIYGMTADVHDAVVGREGAHAEAVAALDGLLADTRPGQVAISTVVVKQNVHQFNELTSFAFERSIMLEAHLPYPMRQTTRDPYAESALPEDEVVRRFVETLGGIPEEMRKDAARWLGHMIRHPCLLWDAEFKYSLPLFGTRALGLSAYMDGTDYRRTLYAHGSQVQSEDSAFAAATVPCPHVADCALSSVCPGEHYTLYQELFGLDAFRPISVQELYGTLLEYKVGSAHEKMAKLSLEDRRAELMAANGKLRTAAIKTIQGQSVQVNALRVLSEFEPLALRALDATRDLTQEARLGLLRRIHELLDKDVRVSNILALRASANLGKKISDLLNAEFEDGLVKVLEQGLTEFGEITQKLQAQMERVERSAGVSPPPTVKAMRLKFDEKEVLDKEGIATAERIAKRARSTLIIGGVTTAMGLLALLVPSVFAAGLAVALWMLAILWTTVSMSHLRTETIAELGAFVTERCAILIERVEKTRDKDWAFHRNRCFSLFERLGVGAGGSLALPEMAELMPEKKSKIENSEMKPFEVILADLQKMTGNPDE